VGEGGLTRINHYQFKETPMKTTSTLMISAMMAVLAGCGSDGSDSSLAAPNKQFLEADTSGITFAYNPAPLSLEESEKIQFSESNALEFARLALVKATAYALNAQINSSSLRSAEDFFQKEDDELTQSCPQGGTLQVAKLDQNNNGRIDPKDIFNLSFSNCQNASGILQTNYESYTGSTASGMLTTNSFVTARDFKGTQPSTGSTAVSQGTEGRRFILGSGRYQYIVHAPNIQIQENEAGKGAANYTILTYLDIQGNLQGADFAQVRMNYREKGDVSTRMEIAADKAYTAQTENLTVSLRDNAAANGDLLVQSAGRLQIRALGNASGRYRVRIGLDANSDGISERSCDFDYAQVLAGTASFGTQGCSTGSPADVQLPILGDLPLLGPVLNNLLGGLAAR